MINTADFSILSKMGFVNVIRVEKIQIGVSRKIALEGAPNKHKLRTLASLPDLNDSENLEFPKMMLNNSFAKGGNVTVKIHISEIFMSFCQDSILGLILLGESAGAHFSKAFRRISKKREEPSSPIKKAGDLFNSVIEEVDEDEDNAMSKNRATGGSFLEEEKFSEDYLDQCLERKSSEFEIRDSFDIVEPIMQP